MREISWEEVSLFSFVLVDVTPIISNYATTRAKRPRTEGKGDRKGSFVRGCLSGANFRSTTGNQIWTIYTNQLTLFHGRFDGNVPHKADLQVILISDQVHCKVEFRDTPNTTVNKNLLSTLNLNWSSSSIDREVSQLFNLFRKTDWKN